jgi:hypothetical protein
MTTGLQGSGTITLGDIEVEVLLARGNQINLADGRIRLLTGVTSGPINQSSAYAKRWVVPNSVTFNFTGGTQYFTVPRYNTITIECWGAGGGATGGCGNDSFAYGYCGGAGASGQFSQASLPYKGNAFYGGATGGVNATAASSWVVRGDGGIGAYYPPGTTSQDYCPPSPGGSGGSGGSVSTGGGAAGGTGCNYGGAGGYVTKTWYYYEAEAPTYGSSINVWVGTGGAGGGGGENGGAATDGATGKVTISWA